MRPAQVPSATTLAARFVILWKEDRSAPSLTPIGPLAADRGVGASLILLTAHSAQCTFGGATAAATPHREGFTALPQDPSEGDILPRVNSLHLRRRCDRRL